MQEKNISLSLSDLTLVTISYNSSEIIDQHLKSLNYQNIKKEERPTWIIVDNNSQDKTRELIEEKYDFTTIVANQENVGFGSAANQGITMAKTRFVVILNPDTLISVKALTQLIDSLIDDNSAAMAGPNVATQPSKGKKEVEWIVGAVMMMDRLKMDSVGYFDPQFFLYFEETDLCIRTIKKGYHIIQNLNAHIPHAVASSSIKTAETTYFLSWHHAKSYVKIAKKHPLKFIAPKKYLRKQKRRLWIARLTFNHKRYLLSHAKVKAITSNKDHPEITLSTREMSHL